MDSQKTNSDSRKIEQLLQELQSDSAADRRVAAVELGKLQNENERIVSALVQVAESDPNKYVRRAAAESLEKLGDDPNSQVTPTPKEQIGEPRQEQFTVTAKDSMICSNCLTVARSESMGSALIGAAGMVLLVPITVVVLSALFGSSFFRDLGGVMGFFFLGTLYGAFEIVRKAISRPCPNCKHAPMTPISSSEGVLLQQKLWIQELEAEKAKENESDKNQQ